MSAESPPLTLTIPSELRLLCVARGFVESVCRLAGLDAGLTSAVVLAVHEAASNAVRHAHHDRHDALVVIRCRPCPDYLEICVLDEGEPFDLGAVQPLNPAELRPGGRGIFLMRKIMDDVSCEPRPGQGNMLRMIKYCNCQCP